MSLSRITSILSYLLAGVSIVLFAMFYFGGKVPGTAGTSMEEPLITETILYWAYIMVGIASVAAMVFPIANMIMNPKNGKKTLIGLGTGLVVIFIAYQFSSGEVMNISGYDGPDNVPLTLKLTDTGLYTTYILASLAIVLILYSEVSKYGK
jgi:hypothetical protein